MCSYTVAHDRRPGRPATTPRIDRLIGSVDQALRTLFSGNSATRPYPAEGIAETVDQPADRRHAAALMRVNHAGEVAAQALYQGQALVAAQLVDPVGIDGGGPRGNRPSRLVRNPHPRAGRPDQPAQSAVVCRLVRDRRARRARRATAPVSASLQRPSDRWWSISKDTCSGCRRRTLARARSSQQMSADEERHGHNALNAGGAELPADSARDDEGDRANHDAHGVLAVARRAVPALAVKRSFLY